MGITPNLVVGTWAGGEDQWMRFLRIDEGQGAYMARPFFVKVIEKIEKSTNIPSFNVEKRFVKPVGDLGITINCGDYYDSGESSNGSGGGEEESGQNTEGPQQPQQPINRDQFQDETEQKPSPAPSASAPAKTKPAPAKPKAADDGFGN
jgi:hypothetical protein